jgi:predicted RNA-binding protein YlqC (UPF0109 family)
MDNSIDQQFIEYVVKSLVGNPDAVQVDRSVDEKGVLLELTVDPEDLGRVIGKRGATAQSLRTLLRALGTKNDARYNLKIIDNGDGSHRDAPTNDTASPTDDSTSQPTAEPTDDTGDGIVSGSASDEPIDIPEEKESDSVSKTRQELAELDDLDI